MATLSEHFLIGAFADYYQELALAKTKIAEGKLAEYLGMNATESDQQLLGILHRKLKARLTEQQRAIRDNATTYEQRDYLKVLYAACALTDEQLLFDVKWEQSEKWQQEYLMERAFFRTECAGSKIFDHIDEILTDRSRVSNRSDLAAVYLLTITLGFVGRYREWDLASASEVKTGNDKAGSEETATLKKENVTTTQDNSPDISVSEPGPLEREKEKLYRVLDKPMSQDYVFAEAYEHVLRMEEEVDKHRIAPLKRWYQYAGYAVLGYLALSTIIWFALTSGVGSEIDSLQTPESCAQQTSKSKLAPKSSGDKCST